jgi:hypothetical protein
VTKAQQTEKAEALAKLRDILKPGDTVSLILRSVSRSGMSRWMSPLLILPDGGTFYLGYLASKALRLRVSDQAVRMDGVGMDMGFALVYELSHAMWPTGYGCTGEGCRSNDHSNGDRDYTPHAVGTRRREDERVHWHREGGYALRHRWL